jgi:hypothetical protein
MMGVGGQFHVPVDITRRPNRERERELAWTVLWIWNYLLKTRKINAVVYSTIYMMLTWIQADMSLAHRCSLLEVQTNFFIVDLFK